MLELATDYMAPTITTGYIGWNWLERKHCVLMLELATDYMAPTITTGYIGWKSFC